MMICLKTCYLMRLAIPVLLCCISFTVKAFDVDDGLTADLYLAQLEADSITMKDKSGSISHISSDVLAEYDEFCLSNIYLGESAPKQAAKIIKYLKGTPEAKGNYAISVTTDRYRAMACLISVTSALHEETGEGKKFRDRINIAGEKNDYAAIKSIYQEWLAYISRYQKVPLRGSSDVVEITRKVMPAAISAMNSEIDSVNQIISRHQVSQKQQQLSQKKSKVKYIDYSTGKIHCESGGTYPVSDCKLDGNHYICESSANDICNGM